MANPVVPISHVANVLSLFLAYYKSSQYISTAWHETAKSFANYKVAFNKVANDLEKNGVRLGEALKKHNIFDDDIIVILDAGATAGELDKVVRDVIASVKRQRTLSKNVLKSVLYQTILLFAVIIISPYLLYNMADNTAKGSALRDIQIQLDQLIELIPFIEFFYPFAVVGAALYAFLSPAIRMQLVNIISKIPVVGSAIINYQVGLWCNYASLMFGAGIDAKEIERLLRPTLINDLQDGFFKIISSLDSGWPVAVEPVDQHDPRAAIPDIARSFLKAGGDSGLLDVQLKELSSYLLEKAADQFDIVTQIFSTFILILVGIGVLLLAMQVYLARM
jgi:type II secretory pathway component PulF